MSERQEGRPALGATVEVTPRTFKFRYRSPEHFIEVFRTWYGPVHKALAALPEGKAAELTEDLVALLCEMNAADASTLVVPSVYLQAVITRG